jgi:hypothetical protein
MLPFDVHEGNDVGLEQYGEGSITGNPGSTGLY